MEVNAFILFIDMRRILTEVLFEHIILKYRKKVLTKNSRNDGEIIKSSFAPCDDK